MKKGIFVYQIPMIPGVPYASRVNVAYRVANDFLKILEGKLKEADMS